MQIHANYILNICIKNCNNLNVELSGEMYIQDFFEMKLKISIFSGDNL